MIARAEVYFYLNGTQHAMRTTSHVPRVGDEVRLRTGLYRVLRVVWNEEREREIDCYVEIYVEPVEEPGRR